MIHASTIFAAQITGIPITKDRCFVLCLNMSMPRTPPAPPPRIADMKRVFSLIRRFLRMALNLSAPISAKVIKLNMQMYMKKA